MADISADLLAPLGQLVPILQRVRSFLPTVITIIEDPALPKIVGHVQTLRATEVSDRKAGRPGPPGPVGIGLHRFLGPIAALVWIRQHPWQTKGIAALGLFAVVGLGFGLGRVSKRCR
jgi:hypothetical protein